MPRFRRSLIEAVALLAIAIGMTILFQHLAHATTNAKIEVRGSADDGSITMTDTGLITKYFTNDVIQVQTVSATASAYTAFTVPTNAKALLIDVGSSQNLKLKGVTGDVGISLDSNCPVLLPISRDATVTVGVQNLSNAARTLKLFWY